MWTYSTLNLQNLCFSLTSDVDNNSDTFRKKPVTTIRSLRIPNLESCISENISSFISDIFIYSEESELIPELLNSSITDWDDAEYLTVHMKFVLEDVSAVLNREVNTDEDDVTYHHPSLYSLLTKHNRIAPSWLNFMYLLDIDAEVEGNILCQWINFNYRSLPDENIPLTAALLSQLLIKVVTSSHLSKEALVVLTRTFRLSLTNVPDNLPLNNAVVLIGQKWLAPTSTVFEQLYQTFYEEGDHLTPLLYELVCIRPSLLSEHCELILFVGNRFNRSLARSLLNGGKVADEVCISVLNWIWKKDEALLSYGPLLSQQTLSRLSGKLTSDLQKQALLIQCLKDSRATHSFIRSLLMTFGHPDYAAFITERSYRSIPYSDSMWSLAVELANSGFIRPPKPTHENTRIRIEPISDAEKEYE